VHEDIADPTKKGGIIEVNAAPGIRMHLFPTQGKPRDVGGAILEVLYPPGSSARIPILSVTGTNGKTTVARMIAHALTEMKITVGMTTTDAIQIAGEIIAKGDMTGPRSARTVLSNPSVEAAVLETARGGIVRSGLGYDWSDISVITNIQPDHIGQDGIESVEDLVHIKSLIAERVREGGTLVLNAEDERVATMVELPRVARTKKEIIYFSFGEDHPVIRKHLAAGGTAYFLDKGCLTEATGLTRHRLIDVADVPATLDGTAEFQIANVLAATAACRAYGLSREEIASSLTRFRCGEHNPGRTNLYQVRGSYVMVDYGHNPDAFQSVCRMTSRWKTSRVTSVIALPGDRANWIAQTAARVAARGFDRILIKEDRDLRGRQPGEMAKLLCQTIHEEVPYRECSVVLDEREALLAALSEVKDGEVIVVFYEKLEPILEVLKQFGAVPVTGVGELVPRFRAA
jgi:cyanophycin synthetase